MQLVAPESTSQASVTPTQLEWKEVATPADSLVMEADGMDVDVDVAGDALVGPPLNLNFCLVELELLPAR